jgi:hypothetical protein
MLQLQICTSPILQNFLLGTSNLLPSCLLTQPDTRVIHLFCANAQGPPLGPVLSTAVPLLLMCDETDKGTLR